MTSATGQLLSSADLAYLQEKNYTFDVATVGGVVFLIIRAYQLPPAYTPRSTDLLLKLPPNFPISKPDMFWTFPHVRLVNGSQPSSANVFDTQHQNRQWQRWSRHTTIWRPGVDDLRTFLSLIHQELQKGI
jgi:hypothetical protein